MRTLHTAYRVTSLSASLAFYLELGYEEVGRVHLPDDVTLVCLKHPDEEVVTLELIDDPASRPIDIGNGISHIGLQVDDLTAMVDRLTEAGITCGPIEHPGPATSWVGDPTATASSWSSGRRATRTGSPPRTSSSPETRRTPDRHTYRLS